MCDNNDECPPPPVFRRQNAYDSVEDEDGNDTDEEQIALAMKCEAELVLCAMEYGVDEVNKWMDEMVEKGYDMNNPYTVLEQLDEKEMQRYKEEQEEKELYCWCESLENEISPESQYSESPPMLDSNLK